MVTRPLPTVPQTLKILTVFQDSAKLAAWEDPPSGPPAAGSVAVVHRVYGQLEFAVRPFGPLGGAAPWPDVEPTLRLAGQRFATSAEPRRHMVLPVPPPGWTASPADRAEHDDGWLAGVGLAPGLMHRQGGTRRTRYPGAARVGCREPVHRHSKRPRRPGCLSNRGLTLPLEQLYNSRTRPGRRWGPGRLSCDFPRSIGPAG